MTTAPTYNRLFNFTNFQSVNPATPLPATQVDAELSQIKVTLDAMLQNTALIQRSDGALANGSVGQVQFADSLSIGFTFRGAWVTGTNYAIADGVFDGFIFYVAKLANLSAATHPASDATNWKVVADFTGSGAGTAAASASAALASQAAALVSQNAASASAAAALVSQNAASASATTASTQATNAGTQATNSLNSATASAASAVTSAASAAISTANVALLRNYLAGLTLSAAGSTSTFAIAAGAAMSSDNVTLMPFPSTTFTKTTGSWLVGPGLGSLDGGTIAASAWYTAYLIERTDTGNVDVLTSLAPGTTVFGATMTIASPAVVTWQDHGLQAGSPVVFTTTGALPTGVTAGTVYFVIAAGLTTVAFEFSTTRGGSAVNTTGSQSGTHTSTSNPILPTNYTKRRRIGSMRTDGASQWLAFSQSNDEFLWLAPTLDVNTTITTSIAALAVVVPLGVVVEALVRVSMVNAAAWCAMVMPFVESGSTVTSVAGGNFNLEGSAGGSAGGDFRIRTTPSQAIAFLANLAATTLRVVTRGWVDSRGRNN